VSLFCAQNVDDDVQRYIILLCSVLVSLDDGHGVRFMACGPREQLLLSFKSSQAVASCLSFGIRYIFLCVCFLC